MDGDLGYSRSWSKRDFQLHQGKRLLVKTTFRRLIRFSCLVRLLSRWRRALLRWGICFENGSSWAPRRCKRDSRFMINGSSRMPVVVERSYIMSNSFHSEAIEECLEFIRRNSVSLQDLESQPLDLEEDGRNLIQQDIALGD
ncbi:hypothetical protein SAY87_016478 [Trapa incisa]|uniref:Uncharacterized protein n=1 Tax=Trapa incisa TaxID=236973 RepID=A0AAN7L641_9MYRT|nr:hypothetical protein SAY87_016478 [Trapa incisa]